MERLTKKQLKSKFKTYLRQVARYATESGNDTFQRIMNHCMSITTQNGMTHRQYLMKYNTNEYAHYVRALRLNLIYAKVNNKGYGTHSWLNCNDTN